MIPIISQDSIFSVKKVTWLGLVANVFLSALKMVAGIFGSSQALVADAVHSLTDISTDLAVLFGVKYWSAPADSSHPYGHWRIETMVSVFIGVMLIAVAIGLGLHALEGLDHNSFSRPSPIVLIVAVLSVVLKEILYRYSINVGRRIKSSAVIANAWHHRSDALSSVPVLFTVAIISIQPKWAFLDGVGAFAVCLFILHAAVKVIWPALLELSDAGAGMAVREEILRLAVQTAGVQAVHAVRTRRLGPGIYADLHVLVDPSMSVKQGHDISEQVKARLLDLGPDIVDVVVHLEPATAAELEPDGSVTGSE